MQILRSALLFFAFFLIVSCDNADDISAFPKDETRITDVALRVVLRDIGNQGNVSDFSLGFTRAYDERKITEYRAFLLPLEDSILLSEAESLAEKSYISFEPRGSNYDTILPIGLHDARGNPIQLETEYRAWILSISDGDYANKNAVSNPSLPMELIDRELSITYIGHSGVFIDGYGKKVLIDAIPRQLPGWSPVPQKTTGDIINGNPPFENTDLLCITHNHEDHFSAPQVSAFGLRNPETRIVGPLQVLDEIILPNESVISLDRFKRVDSVINGVELSIFHFRHFDMFGNDYSAVDNFGYMIEIGGFRILHVGDFDYSNENLDPFDFSSLDIDILIIPTFGTLISRKNKSLIESKIDPDHIIAVHLESSTTISDVKAVFGDIIVFKNSGELVSF